MTVSVFIGTSVDGFIARPNGALDFLPPGGGEPHRYAEFFASVDALVIGRKTLETVLAFPEWPYGDKRVVVLSSRALDFSAVRGGRVEQMAGPPAEIVSKLAAGGVQHVGGKLTLILSVNMFDLTGDERDFVFGVIDMCQGYESRHGKEVAAKAKA